MNSDEKLKKILRFTKENNCNDWYYFNDVMDEITDLIENGEEALLYNVHVV